jgi:hypothetical protein
MLPELAQLPEKTREQFEGNLTFYLQFLASWQKLI